MASEYSASAKSEKSGGATAAATENQNGTAQRQQQQQQQQQRRQSVTTLNCSANGGGSANGGNNKMPNGGHQVCQIGTMPKLTDNHNNNGIINNNSNRNSHSSCGTTISALSGLQNTGASKPIRVGGGPPTAAAIESSGGKVNACSVVVLPLAAPPPPRSLYLFVSVSPLLLPNMSSSPPLLRSASRRRHPQQPPPHSSGSTNANRHNSDENDDDEEEAAPLLQQRKQQAKKHRKTSQNFDEMADNSHQQGNDDGGGKKNQQNLEDGYLIVGKKDGSASSSIHLHHQHRDHLEDLLAREANYSPFDTHLGFYGTAKGSQPSDEEEEDQYGAKIIGVRQTALNRFLLWLRRMRNELKDDFGSILLLLLLYLLQGVPLGLIAAIPLILQSKEITYSQQAVFSFAYWPFSMKLLWARLSIPFTFGALDEGNRGWCLEILGTEDKTGSKLPPNVYFLVCVFLPLNFLAATQDIAVDGWALTMLSRKNVGYASTCNVVGQTIGFFLGNVVFLTLQSKEFANKWIRSVPSDKGLVQFDGNFFLQF
ncbi:hypothetical protein niasHT_025725 [Heterodera trifolii]|uniref:Uncharacterized protein n=1 Tax=Heterodera trifolii TaxID=157864 RepID=A0ABD2K8J6_9BILA